MLNQKIVVVIAISAMHYDSVKPTVAHIVGNYDPEFIVTDTISDRIAADFPERPVKVFGIDEPRSRSAQRRRGASMFEAAKEAENVILYNDPENDNPVVFLSRATSMMSETVAGFVNAATQRGSLIQFVGV